MHQRSFLVAVAYNKTEPVQVAVFGLAFLGDEATFGLAVAISLAIAGAMLMPWKPSRTPDADRSC